MVSSDSPHNSEILPVLFVSSSYSVSRSIPSTERELLDAMLLVKGKQVKMASITFPGFSLSPASSSCRGRSNACKNWISRGSVWYAVFVLFSFTVLLVAGAGSRRASLEAGTNVFNLEEELAEDRDELSDNNTDLWLYAAAMRENPERFYSNFVLSPYSVTSVFRTLVYGAGGETLQQMRRFFSELDEQLEPVVLEEPTVFKSAELLYINSNEEDAQLTAYRESVAAFPTEVRLFDFPSPDAAVAEINAYVNEGTENMIGDIISPEDLPEKPDLTAVSGAILKAQWLDHFASEERRVFHALAPNHEHVDQDDITFVTQKSFKAGEIEYTELPNRGKMIRLPFADKRMAMYIVLPDDYDHLAADPQKINNRIEGYFLARLFYPLQDPDREVVVSIPKFDISPGSCKINVVSALQHVGITQLSEGADFSRLSEHGQNLNLDVWVHEAGIHVDQNGVCVGEGVSSTVEDDRGPVDPPLEFIADRPFLFVVAYEPTHGTVEGLDVDKFEKRDILLNGHVVNAAAAQTPQHD